MELHTAWVFISTKTSLSLSPVTKMSDLSWTLLVISLILHQKMMMIKTRWPKTTCLSLAAKMNSNALPVPMMIAHCQPHCPKFLLGIVSNKKSIITIFGHKHSNEHFCHYIGFKKFILWINIESVEDTDIDPNLILKNFKFFCLEWWSWCLNYIIIKLV